jgi:hypothetical protein
MRGQLPSGAAVNPDVKKSQMERIRLTVSNRLHLRRGYQRGCISVDVNGRRLGIILE